MDFAAGHQSVGGLRKLDVHRQKLLWRTCWLGRNTHNQGDLDEHLNIYDFGFAIATSWRLATHNARHRLMAALLQVRLQLCKFVSCLCATGATAPPVGKLHPLTHLLTHSPTHSLTPSLNRSPAPPLPLTRWLAQSLTRSLVHSSTSPTTSVFDLERLWQLDYGGCCTWTLDANEAGFCSFHLAK